MYNHKISVHVCVQEGRMAIHLDHMRDHVINGTNLPAGNIAVDRWALAI